MVASVVRRWSPERGVTVRRAVASGWSVVFGFVLIAAWASIPWFLPAPLWFTIIWSGLCAAGFVMVFSFFLKEWRAGPLIEIATDDVSFPRLSRSLGKYRELVPVLLKVSKTIVYTNGRATQRFTLPAIEHRGAELTTLIILPLHMVTLGSAKRLLRRLVERSDDPLAFEVASVEERNTRMPSDD